MQLILASIISIIIGAVVGYLFCKSRSQHIVIDKELLARELELLKAQQKNWDEFHQESLKSAKAVMFEASREVSKELLDNHKRENAESKKQAEEATQKTTEKLNKEFQTVVEKLAAINSQVAQQGTKVSTIWQALSSPSGAGQFAEIGLENTLKSFGLEKDRDFITQFSVNHDGRSLRPDAVVFLPDGNLMVIDSKSSKFFLELAAENADEAMLLERLKRTMSQHLTDLSGKDYSNAVRQSTKTEFTTVINVMYVPSESARIKIMQCDPEFSKKCMARNILLADPSGIQLLLHVARYQITRAKQEANHNLIVKEISKLISSMDNFVRGLDAVGKSIKRSAEHFGALSNSVNSRLLPRIRRVLDLGAETEKEMKLPHSLPNFNVIENEAVVVDLEAEPVDNLRTLEKKAG